MNKKQKSIIFLSFLVLFIIISPVVILYSQGFRLDIHEKKIIKTGGLFLRVKPPGVKIYINHILSRKTHFILDSVFLGNLFPKRYSVLVKKEGYQPWHKDLLIREMKVTEAKNIYLFKKQYPEILLMNKVEDFYEMPDKKFIIVKKKLENNNWSLWLYNLDTDQKNLLISSNDLLAISSYHGNNLSLENIIFSKDSQRIILKTAILKKDKKTKENRFFLINKNHQNRIVELPLDNYHIKKIFFNPQDNRIIFLTNKGTIFYLGSVYKTKPIRLSSLGINNILDIDCDSQYIYALAKNGFIYQLTFSNSQATIQSILNLSPYSISEKHGSYSITVLSPQNVFIKEGKKISFLEQQKRRFLILKNNVNKMALSPEKHILIFSDQHTLYLLFLKQQLEQPKAYRLERIPLVKFNPPFGDLKWFNNWYVIYSDNNGIHIVETDFRDNINKYDVVKYPVKKFTFINSTKSLLFILKDNLFKITIE